jgi:2-polyprenyl-6-hydroxyphenyl methylase/3-demethylubiquinone-9 3-methyltransferase
MTSTQRNVDPAELSKFGQLAEDWWDPDGPLRTLHAINPLRLDYIAQRATLANARVLDVGCGGGLLAEALARAGASVTGIDLAEASLGVASQHAAASQLEIDYRRLDVASLAETANDRFDIVTCLEVLEHVPDPAATVEACSALVCPGGHVFFSTINRNPKSFLLAIVTAEYVLGLLPRGTHEYQKLIRPAELARWCRAADLEVEELTGLHMSPVLRTYYLGGNVDVNYFCHAVRRTDA